MFDCYDNSVFSGTVACIAGWTAAEFSDFEAADARAAGKTSWRRYKVPCRRVPQESFEISVSSHLLFSTISDETREVTVTETSLRESAGSHAAST